MLKFVLVVLFLITGIWLLFSSFLDILFGIFGDLFSALDIVSKIVIGLVLLFLAWILIN